MTRFDDHKHRIGNALPLIHLGSSTRREDDLPLPVVFSPLQPLFALVPLELILHDLIFE